MLKRLNLPLAVLLLGACSFQTATDETGISSTSEQNLQDMRPEETEDWSIEPRQLSFGHGGIPSDATILFDGSSLNAWQDDTGQAPLWSNENGVLTVQPGTGGIRTVENFCDLQLHIEWKSPTEGMNGNGTGQLWGNSGVFLQGRYELQVLNSFENKTYANGQAGSMYKQHPPLVNASKPPGQWQTYDIIFTAPEFAENGDVISSARITAFHNGVLVQNNSELLGSTTYIGQPKYEPHGCLPLRLQDHGEAVEFRNIWARKL